MTQNLESITQINKKFKRVSTDVVGSFAITDVCIGFKPRVCIHCVEGGKLEIPTKNPRSRDDNQQQTAAGWNSTA